MHNQLNNLKQVKNIWELKNDQMDNWERPKALNPSREKNIYDLARLIFISFDPLSFFIFTFLWVVLLIWETI